MKKNPGTRTKITNDGHFIVEKDSDFGHIYIIRHKDYPSASYLLLKKLYHIFFPVYFLVMVPAEIIISHF